MVYQKPVLSNFLLYLGTQNFNIKCSKEAEFDEISAYRQASQ